MALQPEDASPHSHGETEQTPLIRRGAQSHVALKAAIIGGGKACDELLKLLAEERFSNLNMEILGVADPDPKAPGRRTAEQLGIFTTRDFADLYALAGLNLLIELTGSVSVRDRMIHTKPSDVSTIDHRGARLLWDLIQMEAEKQKIERKSEERLLQFLESAHDIICIKDHEGRYEYVNPAATAALGITPKEVVGRTDFELLPHRLAEGMVGRDDEVRARKQMKISRDRMRVNDRMHHFHTVRFPLLDDTGALSSIAILSRDITEEVELREEVERNKEYLENILRNSSDMIITTDLEGRIVTFNEGGEQMLGYSKEEVLGSGIEVLWQAPDERRKLMTQVKEKGYVRNFPAVLIAKEGNEVEISLSLSQLRDARGRVLGTVGVSKDVTEENRLRRQLLEQERLAAVGQTVAGITHCMKNVLNGLKGGAYMVNVALKRNKPELLEEGWASVEKGIQRIGKLSLDMLNYCRDRNPRPVPTDPLQLARDAVELVREAAAQEGIMVQCRGDSGPPVLIDPDAVSRALLNLVSNGVDACREKTYPAGMEPRVDLEVSRGPEEIRFAVRDNGVGMTAEVRRKLFERFFSTKDAKGTGLGLCVSGKIIEENGGRIEVESRPGEGSTFTIIVPEAAQQSSGETS